MNRTEQRNFQILKLLSHSGRLPVAELAEQCGVSLVTMRKDLTFLEESGLIRREQGAAAINASSPMASRMITGYEAKRRLAEKAVTLVKDGDTVLIESGSCCIHLAEAISRNRKNVTVITNSVFMTEHAGRKKDMHLILLGGDYQAESEALVGPLTGMCARTFHVRLFFCGTDGYRENTGFTGDDHLRAETLRTMASSADQVVILAESQKFGHSGIVSLFSPDEVSLLVTDEKLSPGIAEELTRKKVQIL